MNNYRNKLKPCNESCPLCGGTGIIDCGDEGFALCPNDPRRFRDTGVRESDLDVPKKLKPSATLRNIDKALKALLDTRSGLAYIAGSYGIGKTVTAKAYTAKAVKVFEGEIYYRRASELVNWLRKSYDTEHGQVEYQRRLDTIKNANWLVIDELGRDRMTDFARESLNEILDARYMGAIQELNATVLLSNFTPEQVFEPYVVDRIMDEKNTYLNLRTISLRTNTLR